MNLFLNEFKRSFLIFKRYPSEAIAVTVMMVVMFYLLFMGTSYMAGPTAQFGERLDQVIVGYVVWMLMFAVFAGMATDIQSEAQTGTLEQIVLSAKSLTSLIAMRAVATLLLNLLITLVVLLVIMLLVGRQLHFSFQILPALLPITLGTMGLGFVLASFALMVKRVNGILAVMQFGLMFLILAPVESWTGTLGYIGQALPVASASSLLRGIMVNAETLSLSTLGQTLLVNAIYLTAGMLLFSNLLTKAKKTGLLGKY